jgi:SAM-dependent methyltransferase
MYIRRYLPAGKTARILDAGCGNGKYAFKLVNDGYANIDAIDLFESITTDKFHYQRASIDDMPFHDSTFDFVYCNSVIYYLPDIEKGFTEFNRVLKGGGTLFITAHTKYSLFTLWRVVKRIVAPNRIPHLMDVPFYTAAQYSTWLEKNGFDVILVDGYELVIFFSHAYRRFVRACQQYLGIELPQIHNRITRTKFMARMKSIFGYHSIIVAKKIRFI